MPDGWLDIDDPRFPDATRHVDPPLRGAWFAGDVDLLGRRPRIGIVGSRAPRADATSIARRITRDAARAGFVVVSGLAIGIDGLAHLQALDAGAATIGVLPGGLGEVYPRHNVQLAQRIAGSARGRGVAAGRHPDAPGLVLSEYGAGTEDAHAYRFRQRNRIIAALSDYLVVVQATHRSGSMITARHAIDLGIPIGIVPSAPSDACYSGSIELIHDGADAVVDGASLFRRLEVHGVMRPGFAEAARRGAVVDHDRPGSWTGGGAHEQLRLADHPLASLLQVPRTLEEVAELAGMRLGDARLLLLELEDDDLVAHTDDGAWLSSDAPPGG